MAKSSSKEEYKSNNPRASVMAFGDEDDDEMFQDALETLQE